MKLSEDVKGLLMVLGAQVLLWVAAWYGLTHGYTPPRWITNIIHP